MSAYELDLLRQSAAGLPFFALYLLASLLMLGLFMMLYIYITPHRELALIRNGNISAAASLSGALIGFVIPLSKTVTQAASIVELFMWSAAALIIQLVAYVLAGRALPNLSQRIVADDRAAGLFMGAFAIAVGLLNSAAMTTG